MVIQVPIIAACYEITIARKLAMVWGVYPILIEKPSTGVTLMYISFRLDLSEIIVILFHHGNWLSEPLLDRLFSCPLNNTV